MDIRTIFALLVVGAIGSAVMWLITGLSDPVAVNVGIVVGFVVLVPLGLAIGFALDPGIG